MQVPLEIATRGITLSDRQMEDVRVRARKLEAAYDRITRCSIFVEGPGDHKRTGGPYKVRVELAVPGTVLVADRRRKEHLRAAINAAFSAARRQLEEHVETRRGQVKSHGQRFEEAEAAGADEDEHEGLAGGDGGAEG